jgi:REP element-mobilizing transposase RayT
MAPPRIVDPTGLHHVFSRGNFRQTIFPTTDHYLMFLARLERAARRRYWLVLDWCLLPNHYHLLVRLQDGGLSEGMRELNGTYSRWSNRLADRTGTGHLVKNRFGCTRPETDGHLWELFRYIPNNPVEAGLVAAPEDWPWSGFRATLGLDRTRPFHQPSELLRYFGDCPETAVERYRQYVTTPRTEVVPAAAA